MNRGNVSKINKKLSKGLIYECPIINCAFKYKTNTQFWKHMKKQHDLISVTEFCK